MPQSNTSHGVGFEVGDRVYDPDTDSGTAVVVLTPDATAEDWDVTEDETVADLNPDYDADAPVVLVAFEDDLDEWWDDWRDYDADELFDELCERGHKFYAFPAPRLAETKESTLERIENALRSAGYPVRRRDATVVVDKFGEYVVHPDGTVEGDGALTDRLRAVVKRSAL